MFYFIDHVLDETGHVCEELEFFSTYFGILVFLFYSCFCILLTFIHIWLIVIPLIVIMRRHLYVSLQLLWFIIVNFHIACSGYFRLNVYTWDNFLAYICRWLSSRLRFYVFWEAGRDNMTTKLIIATCKWENDSVRKSKKCKREKEKDFFHLRSSNFQIKTNTPKVSLNNGSGYVQPLLFFISIS